MMQLLRTLFGQRAQRHVFEGPVAFGANSGFGGIARGRTKNLSATGVYFETTEAREVGSAIYFTIEFAGGASIMHCSGVIVRREVLANGRIGFGVKIESQRIDRPR